MPPAEYAATLPESCIGTLQKFFSHCLTVEMSLSWTHLVRFVAFEDDQVHLGQLVDPTRDVGLDSTSGVPVYAFKVEGTMFNGRVTENVLQVRKVCQALYSVFA
jgi:hypothetical protein